MHGSLAVDGFRQRFEPGLELLRQATTKPPVASGRKWPGRAIRGALSKRSPARRTFSVAGGLLAWPGTHAPGQEPTVAAGSFLAPQRAVLAPEAAAKQLPDSGPTEVGTHR